MKKHSPCFVLLICLLSLQSQAQDMVYKPKNPAFGGDTFNYNWLLASAQAQDLTNDKKTTATAARNTADDFAQSLNRLLLNQISRELITNQFGENGLQDGLYTFGDFQLDVTTTLEGLSITIFDQNGGQTQIAIPFF